MILRWVLKRLFCEFSADLWMFHCNDPETTISTETESHWRVSWLCVNIWVIALRRGQFLPQTDLTQYLCLTPPPPYLHFNSAVVPWGGFWLCPVESLACCIPVVKMQPWTMAKLLRAKWIFYSPPPTLMLFEWASSLYHVKAVTQAQSFNDQNCENSSVLKRFICVSVLRLEEAAVGRTLAVCVSLLLLMFAPCNGFSCLLSPCFPDWTRSEPAASCLVMSVNYNHVRFIQRAD